MTTGLRFLNLAIIYCLLVGCLSETIVLEQNTSKLTENLTSSESTDSQSPVATETQDELVIRETILINDEKGYFYIEMLSSNYSVLVKVLDQNLNHSDIQISKQHPVIYIDSFKNYILVKQVDNATQTKKQQGNENVTLQSLVAYYVYSIERSGQQLVDDNENKTFEERPKFYARQRLVNASFDSSSFPIPQGYVLTEILEVDEVNSIMYVVMKGLLSQTTVIYQINLQPYQPQLNMFSWFVDQNLNKIKGNSRVIADVTNKQLLIQSNSSYNSVIEQTSYLKKNFSDLTTLNLSSDLMKVVKIYGSSFLVLSLTSNKKKLNGFLYHGYGEEDKVTQISLASNDSLKMFCDSYSYGIYVGSDDMVWVQVGKDQKTQKETSSVSKLSDQIKDSTFKISILNDFQEATQIFYINKEAHLITSKKYIVYSNTDFTLTKIYEQSLNSTQSIGSSQKTSNVTLPNPYDVISNNRVLLQFIQSYKQRSI